MAMWQRIRINGRSEKAYPYPNLIDGLPTLSKRAAGEVHKGVLGNM
jgi:hypothetical protein